MQTNTIEASSEDFGVLARQVREAGLLDRRFGYYSAKIPLTVAAFGAGFAGLILLGNSWFALAIAAFLGLMFTQLGFVGHDAGHQEVFRSRRANRLLGFAVGNVLIGMSFGWWVPKHSAHHAHPNEMGRDPDIGDGLADPCSGRGNERHGEPVHPCPGALASPVVLPAHDHAQHGHLRLSVQTAHPCSETVPPSWRAPSSPCMSRCT